MNWDVYPVYLLASVTGLCVCAREGDDGTLVATDSSSHHLPFAPWGQPVIVLRLGEAPSSPLCLHSRPSSSPLPTQQPEASIRNVNGPPHSSVLNPPVFPSHSRHTHSLPWTERLCAMWPLPASLLFLTHSLLPHRPPAPPQTLHVGSASGPLHL